MSRRSRLTTGETIPSRDDHGCSTCRFNVVRSARRGYLQTRQLLLGGGPCLGARFRSHWRHGSGIAASVEDEQVDVPAADLGLEPLAIDVVRLPLEPAVFRLVEREREHTLGEN